MRENIDNVMAVLIVCDEVYDADNSLFIGRPEVLGVTGNGTLHP